VRGNFALQNLQQPDAVDRAGRTADPDDEWKGIHKTVSRSVGTQGLPALLRRQVNLRDSAWYGARDTAMKIAFKTSPALHGVSERQSEWFVGVGKVRYGFRHRA
jgi:hypothetical protein